MNDEEHEVIRRGLRIWYGDGFDEEDPFQTELQQMILEYERRLEQIKLEHERKLKQMKLEHQRKMVEKDIQICYSKAMRLKRLIGLNREILKKDIQICYLKAALLDKILKKTIDQKLLIYIW